VGDAIRNAGNNHAARAPADQDGLRQVLVEEVVDDIGDVCRQVDRVAGEVDSLTDTGQARRRDRMAGLPQGRNDPAPAPAAKEAAMHKHKCGHGLLRIR
jgi:hypothetical protein